MKTRKYQIEHLKELNLEEIKELTKQPDSPVAQKESKEDKEVTLSALKERLLSLGGERVCIPYEDEPDLKNILMYGQSWNGKSYMKKGEPCQCHRNSCFLWSENDKNCVIATGYALSRDGVWRQHSWVIRIKPRVNNIIETTTSREMYYGFAMTYELCGDFLKQNY